MAISVDHASRLILIPLADLTLIGTNRYSLDLQDLRLWLRDWEDDADNADMPPTHNHNTEVELAGYTYARMVEIINGYTVEFDDPLHEHYAVYLTGANHNILDVVVFNGVSIASQNSAGLIREDTSAVQDGIADVVWGHASAVQLLADNAFMRGIEGGRWVLTDDQMIFYDSDNVTELCRFDITRDANDNPIERTRV
jgi:hypothetical protein